MRMTRIDADFRLASLDKVFARNIERREAKSALSALIRVIRFNPRFPRGVGAGKIRVIRFYL
jgi:hypothetical protein